MGLEVAGINVRAAAEEHNAESLNVSSPLTVSFARIKCIYSPDKIRVLYTIYLKLRTLKLKGQKLKEIHKAIGFIVPG